MKKLKQQYLLDCANEWDQAIESMKNLKTEYPQELDLLVNNWDLISFDIGFCVTDHLRKVAYNFPYTLLGAMNFISFFISHEIHDDGTPCLIYLAHTWNKDTENLFDLTSVKASDSPDKVILLLIDRWDLKTWLEANPFENHGFIYKNLIYFPEVAEPVHLESLTRAVEFAKIRKQKTNKAMKDLLDEEDEIAKESNTQRDLKEILQYLNSET